MSVRVRLEPLPEDALKGTDVDFGIFVGGLEVRGQIINLDVTTTKGEELLETQKVQKINKRNSKKESLGLNSVYVIEFILSKRQTQVGSVTELEGKTKDEASS